MDETKETKGDSLQSGKAPTGEVGTTPTPEVYTKAQLEEAIQKDRIQRGRDTKTLEQRDSAIKAREEAIKAKEEAQESAELEKVKEDPDALAAYKDKKARKKERDELAEERAQLERDKAEHAAEIQAAREAQKEITIWQVASAKNIDPMRLKALSDKFSIEGKEKLEELADEIGSGKTDKQIDVDSGMTAGSAGEKSEEQRLKDRYPTMYPK